MLLIGNHIWPGISFQYQCLSKHEATLISLLLEGSAFSLDALTIGVTVMHSLLCLTPHASLLIVVETLPQYEEYLCRGIVTLPRYEEYLCRYDCNTTSSTKYWVDMVK
jgi:hypothetical protein